MAKPTFDEYLADVKKRLVRGAADYGDKSFEVQLSNIAKEMQEECLDIAGWGYILYCRLEALKGMARVLESPDPIAAQLELFK